jgi:hypothetical protein
MGQRQQEILIPYVTGVNPQVSPRVNAMGTIAISYYTAEAIAERRRLSALIRALRDSL